NVETGVAVGVKTNETGTFRIPFLLPGKYGLTVEMAGFKTYSQPRLELRIGDALDLPIHSAHISKETRSYLDTVPQRFVFVFTPTHGSWLNLIENQFSKMTRTMLREIRVGSKKELIDRIHQYYEEINADPVQFRWKYKIGR